MSEKTVTLVVEKWAVKPPDGDYAKFMVRSEKEIRVRETAKRFITLENNPNLRRTFDKATGREIKDRSYSSWFRYSIKVAQSGQPAQQNGPPAQPETGEFKSIRDIVVQNAQPAKEQP